MRKRLFLSTLAVPFFAVSAANGASSFLFDFNNGGLVSDSGTTVTAVDAGGAVNATPFDQGDVGDVITLTNTLADPADGPTILTTTVVEIFAPEFIDTGSGFVLTGNTLLGSNGLNLQLNTNGSSSLGITNPSIPNSNGGILSGAETDLISPGEGFTLSFNQNIEFTQFEVEGTDPGDSFAILVDGVDFFVAPGTEGGFDLSSIAGQVILAGSEVTFEGRGPQDVTSLAIESFTVTASVPEPSSVALLGLGGLMLFKRRRS